MKLRKSVRLQVKALLKEPKTRVSKHKRHHATKDECCCCYRGIDTRVVSELRELIDCVPIECSCCVSVNSTNDSSSETEFRAKCLEPFDMDHQFTDLDLEDYDQEVKEPWWANEAFSEMSETEFHAVCLEKIAEMMVSQYQELEGFTLFPVQGSKTDE